jgi:hypothetical protein
MTGMKDQTYRPDHFKDIADTQLGQQLWDFLNEPDIVLRMETASELERPAVEAIGHLLAEKFGQAEIAPDRVKQAIGHMIRQVLESKGLQVDAQGIRIRGNTVFSKGTRYRLTAAEVLLKLQQDLAEIRRRGAAGGGRAAVEKELHAAMDLYASARTAHPHLKSRLEMVVNTHARLAPELRVRILRAGN